MQHVYYGKRNGKSVNVLQIEEGAQELQAVTLGNSVKEKCPSKRFEQVINSKMFYNDTSAMKLYG